MSARCIVRGQKVSEVNIARAKRMRRCLTREERMLWERLRNNQLAGFHFRRQQIICGYIADFYCHAAGVVVEVDGEIHRQRFEHDKHRDVVFAARDLNVIHVKNHEVNEDIEKVLRMIEVACRGT
ncbi:MAG: endonuclease domain-containing protein [Armatimonadota bacterium]